MDPPRDEAVQQRYEGVASRGVSPEARLILDGIPGLVALLAADGGVEVVNRRLLDYTGCTLDELRHWGRSDVVHPNDLPGVADVFGRSVAAGRPYDIVQRLRRSDGVYRWFLNSGHPLRDAGGRVTRWCVLLTDIDERKRAEDALRVDIEHRKRVEAELRRANGRLAEAQRLSKTGSFITDVRAEERAWSEEALRIFEFDPATHPGRDQIRAAIHPDDRPIFDGAYACALAGQDWDVAFRIVTPTGKLKHVRAVGHVMAAAEGGFVHVGAIQDVTESKLAEEALSQARTELAHVARITTLSTLTASIAHEVNQPLSGIITNAGTCLRLLDADPPNVEGARETARRTIRDGNRAADVIARLRALFSGKERAREAVDLNDATLEVVTLSLSELRRNNVIVQTELADDLPLVVGDRVQLQEVVLNLLRNASDAMAGVTERPREVVIRTEEDAGDRVRLTVRDAGVGIAQPAPEALFDAFYTTKPGGMGIGLSVSRSIIESHHGYIWAERNDGPGATVAFSIPCRPPRHRAREEAVRDTKVPSPAAEAGPYAARHAGRPDASPASGSGGERP